MRGQQSLGRAFCSNRGRDKPLAHQRPRCSTSLIAAGDCETKTGTRRPVKVFERQIDPPLDLGSNCAYSTSQALNARD
jgi:hypothetical protein